MKMFERSFVSRRFETGVSGVVRPRWIRAVSYHPTVALRSRSDRTGEQAEKALDADLVVPVVDLDLIAVEVEVSTRVGKHLACDRIARIAGNIVRQHQDDVAVWDAQALDSTIPADGRKWRSIRV